MVVTYLLRSFIVYLNKPFMALTKEDNVSLTLVPTKVGEKKNAHRRNTHLFSAASMLMASMMLLTFSVICLALIVCCSNFVFTADCEIHSCEAITHKLL